MDLFKDSLRSYEQENGRNNECRRFVNFMLKGGTTPQRETTIRHHVAQAPLRVLFVGHSTTNSTANTLKHVFQPLFGIATYNVVTALDFVGPEYVSEPYTHIIVTGHCHSANGTLEDDDNNRIDIHTIMEKIKIIQHRSEYKIAFYNCQSYSRIYMYNDKAIVQDLSVSNATEAYFCIDNVLRFGVGTSLPGRLHSPQKFSQWVQGRNPPVLLFTKNMIEFASIFFDKNIPDIPETVLGDLPVYNTTTTSTISTEDGGGGGGGGDGSGDNGDASAQTHETRETGPQGEEDEESNEEYEEQDEEQDEEYEEESNEEQDEEPPRKIGRRLFE